MVRKRAADWDPWAICTASVGRGDPAKFERCVLDVKKKKTKKSERLVLEKAAGFNLIDGRPQAQFTGYTRVPGQVPGQTTPLAVRPRLDPELTRELEAKPPAWSVNRHLGRAPLTARDVVRGLGLSKATEERLAKLVAREVLSSPNRVTLAKGVVGVTLQEGLPPDVRQVVNYRALQLYGRVLRKSGFREVFRPAELVELRKATGGPAVKYVAKVDRAGSKKARYYYDEKKYRDTHGTHTSGEEGSRQMVSRNALRCVAKAGDGGCGLDGFRDLVRKYGAGEVHRAVRGAVESGDVDYRKGRFRMKAKKEQKTNASKK